MGISSRVMICSVDYCRIVLIPVVSGCAPELDAGGRSKNGTNTVKISLGKTSSFITGKPDLEKVLRHSLPWGNTLLRCLFQTSRCAIS